MVFHAHNIISHSVVHKSFLYGNEEKVVPLPVYSSFIRGATSGFRINPYSLGVVFVFRNEEKLVAILVYSSFRRVASSGFRTSPYSLVVVFVFRSEEKLVAILVYSSFRPVATSSFRIFPKRLVVETSCAQMRSDSGIIPYSSQHCSTV